MKTFLNFNKTQKFQQDLEISTKFRDFDEIIQKFQQNYFEILTKFKNFNEIISVFRESMD